MHLKISSVKWRPFCHSHSALFDVVTPPLSCSFSYLYIGPTCLIYTWMRGQAENQTGTSYISTKWLCILSRGRWVKYRSSCRWFATRDTAPVTQAIFNTLLSGVPDYFDRNKILSGYDLSHYQVPHCIRVFFYFVWFVFIHHNFQFYFKSCTYCNILDIYLSWNLNFVNYLLFYMKLLNYLFFNMFGSVLECCELTGVSLLWPWIIKWK